MKEQTALPACKFDAPWKNIVNASILEALKLDSLASASAELREQIYDVAVIGGGIAGLSAARAAAKKGASVILLERAEALAAGASGKNAGILGAGVNMPLVSMPAGHPAMGMWQRTSDLLPELYALANDRNSKVVARKTGALSLARSATACKRLQQEAKARRAAGLNAEMISPAKVADMTCDYLDLRGVHGALLLPDEGRINPLTLLAHITKETREFGATLVGGANVSSRVVISGESVPFSYARRSVINSAPETAIGTSDESFVDAPDDVWKLSTSCGIDIFASALICGMGPVVNANRRIYAISFRIDLPEDFPLFWDAAPFTYYDYRAGEGYITVSGGRYGTAGQSANDAKFHAAMIAATKAWLPALRKSEPSHMWAVNLEVAADMMPQSITLNKHPIALSIEGLGALGVLPGMVLGAEAGSKIARRFID